MRADDPAFVAAEYATERGLTARSSIYGHSDRDARDVVLDELRSLTPSRVLEVGCGWGELAARIEDEVGCAVVALDLSPRMVELARERGVDARAADVQEMPFAAADFDAVVSAWMLYHVPDLERGLSEIARVLRPGGVLVAVTNGAHDLHEVWDLVGRDLEPRRLTFRTENGEHHLRRHFQSVRRVDVVGQCAVSRRGRDPSVRRLVRPRQKLRRPRPRLGGASRCDEDRRRVRRNNPEALSAPHDELEAHRIFAPSTGRAHSGVARAARDTDPPSSAALVGRHDDSSGRADRAEAERGRA